MQLTSVLQKCLFILLWLSHYYLRGLYMNSGSLIISIVIIHKWCTMTIIIQAPSTWHSVFKIYILILPGMQSKNVAAWKLIHGRKLESARCRSYMCHTIIFNDVCRVTTMITTLFWKCNFANNSICFQTIWKACGVSNFKNLTSGLFGGNYTTGRFIKTMLRWLLPSWHNKWMTSTTSLKKVFRLENFEITCANIRLILSNLLVVSRVNNLLLVVLLDITNWVLETYHLLLFNRMPQTINIIYLWLNATMLLELIILCIFIFFTYVILWRISSQAFFCSKRMFIFLQWISHLRF